VAGRAGGLPDQPRGGPVRPVTGHGRGTVINAPRRSSVARAGMPWSTKAPTDNACCGAAPVRKTRSSAMSCTSKSSSIPTP
jgi:hypothetical protein